MPDNTWKEIDKLESDHSDRSMTVYYCPKHKNKKGHFVEKHVSFIRWPEFPYTHYLVFPEYPPNPSHQPAGEARSDA